MEFQAPSSSHVIQEENATQPYPYLGAAAMSLPADIDSLISELAAPLEPPDRAAFVSAAERALVGLNCAGLGLAYRLLAPIQRAHFDPPVDARMAAGPRHHRPNRLNSLPPVGAEDPRAVGRQRAQWARR
jgi:hypothetical protein